MQPIFVWALVALLVLDCAAYVWGLRGWLVYLRAQRLAELSPAGRAERLAAPEYRRLRARAQWPVTVAAFLFVALMMVSRL